MENWEGWEECQDEYGAKRHRPETEKPATNCHVLNPAAMVGNGVIVPDPYMVEADDLQEDSLLLRIDPLPEEQTGLEKLADILNMARPW